MISAPDTPYGDAFKRFLVLLAHRPLNLRQLHEAFASLSSIAVRDHPNMPWPTVMRMGHGQTIPFTVEALLARKNETYAEMPTVPADVVRGWLVRWEGVTVKTVVSGGQDASFQLHLVKKKQIGPKSMRTHDIGSLCVSCSWQLKQEHQVMCTSVDTATQIEQSLRRLKGLSLVGSQLESTGILLLKWTNKLWLEIQPDGWPISADYSLDFGWDDEQPLACYRYEGCFVAREQSADYALGSIENS